MSLVELKGIRCQKDQVILELGSLDLVDGTPVVDIKPYLPFAEALPDASASYAQQGAAGGYERQLYAGNRRTVTLRWKNVTHISKRLSARCWRRIRVRPTEKEEQAGKTYAVWLLDFNVRWRVIASGFEVFALEAR